VQTTAHADGAETHYDLQTHTTINTDRFGHITTLERPGMRAAGFRADGHAAHIEQSRPDGSRMVVDRGFHGERRVEVVHPNGVRVVTVGRQGFVERPLRPGYVSRTYLAGGRPVVRVYRTYAYRNVPYTTFVPAVYYQPAFYGWLYSPWGVPAAYAWGWGPAPWYSFFGGYFAPESAYPNASMWLTDFLLAQDLQNAYEDRIAPGEDAPPAQQDAPAMQTSAVPLTSDVKQMLAEEVRQQLADEQAVAAQPLLARTGGLAPQPAGGDTPPPALDPNLKVFVVSTGLTASAASGDQTCALTPGDVIERTGRGVTDDGKVAVHVLNSKAGDCPAGFATALDAAALQDMYTQFQEQIASGLDTLAKNRGQGGLPPSPAANPRPVADGQAPADADAKDLLAKQAQDADQTEAEINQDAAGPR
jgi:hypothetical protein